MSAEVKKEIELEIAHVLCIDIVGYSKLLLNEQRMLVDTLNQIVRCTHEFRSAEAAGKLIKIPTGDGMVLVFYKSPEAPVECALEISRALKENPELRVRMGVHSGPVSGVVDVNENANIAGAGINLAQRVMDCGDAGHILLSRHVAEDLEHSERWRSHLYDLGECEVKYGVMLSLVNLYTEDVGNREIPSKLRQQRDEQAVAARTAGARRRRKVAIVGVVVVVAIAACLTLFITHRTIGKRAAGPLSSLLEKNIAVLPFENLSRDPDNAYFVEGIQDEILTRLAKIGDLKVISRASTQRFKTVPDNLSVIAKQLGVANILEGSVQKAADQVRVNVQLINARTDAHLWAETYDRKLTDIFAVESDIAKTIAETLRAKLTGAEQSVIAARPTQNSDAYELYLRGRYFFGKRTSDDFMRAIDYFNQAIAKDPNYAPAYAGIADSYVLLPEYSNEPAVNVFPKARMAANKALALDNNLAEAHVSLGLVLHGADLNLKQAKREFEHAIQLNPNYPAAHYFLALLVLAPLGQFDQAIAEVKRAVELDPFSVIMNTNAGYCYLLARRYPEAIAQLRKTVELDPNFPYARGVLGGALELSGDSAGAIREYEKAYEIEKAYEVGPHFGLLFLACAYARRGEGEKALQLLDQVQDLRQRAGGGFCYGSALIHLALGDKNQAIDWLERSYQAKETGIIGNIKVDPFLDPLRGDPRFEKLANKIIPPDSY